jgi:uncharacterized protein (TIGR02246 family)
MRRRTLTLAALLLLLAAGRGRAQDLEQVLERFSSAWRRGDASAIAALVTRRGVSIDVDGETIGPLGQRQCAALLRRLFDDRRTVEVRAGLARLIGGAPPRAYGEIAWLAQTRGTTIPEHATVFLALIREEDGWRITQIRLLR